MILPLGVDRFEFKRTPWVTFMIIAINFIIFGFTSRENYIIEKNIRRLEKQYISYLTAHPYLKYYSNLYYEEFPEELRKYTREGYKRAVRSGFTRTGAFCDAQHELDVINDEILYWYEQRPERKLTFNPSKWKKKAIITSMFFHFNWLHIFFNMLFLYFTGPFLEEAWGKPKFLLLYFGSGIFADIAANFYKTDINIYSGGASAAVSGVAAAFLFWFWNKKLKFLWWGFLIAPFRAPAWIILIFELIKEWYYGNLYENILREHPGVGYWAHFWGLLFGLAFAYFIKKLWKKPWFHKKRIRFQPYL